MIADNSPELTPEPCSDSMGHMVKRTYNLPEHPRGRPSKHQKKAEKKLKAKDARFLPQGRNWGGRRRGAGRPKHTGPKAKKMRMVKMDQKLAEALESLPEGKRSEYIRQAVELMTDIQPPDKFLASGKEKQQASGGTQ